MLRLTSEECAELLLVLNDVDLTARPHVQRIRERLQALQPAQSPSIHSQSPQVVASIVQAPPPTPPEQQPLPKSQIPAPIQPEYTMTDHDREFCSVLHRFRRDRMRALYGLAILNNLGPGLIMGDTILDRIAECARARTLTSLDDLYRETRWDQTWELGEQVLELVSMYYPSPPQSDPQSTLVDDAENVKEV